MRSLLADGCGPKAGGRHSYHRPRSPANRAGTAFAARGPTGRVSVPSRNTAVPVNFTLGAFELASRLAQLAPGNLDHVFFTNSGSEAVDTALKIAIAYHHARGEPTRTRLIGRERGYHGVNFGGISVGGIVTNRKM